MTKPSFARNVSFSVLRNQPACLVQGSLRATTSMSACVCKVLVLFHRHTCKRTRGCLTPNSVAPCGNLGRALATILCVARMSGCD